MARSRDDPREHHHGRAWGGQDHRDPALAVAAPPNEKWAVVVNEFGALGIDGAVLDTAAGIADADVAGTSTTGGGDGGVVVREVAGGCLCCAVAAPFTVAVTQVLRRAKPDRLLIEPSGMGHPGGLFDALSGEFLRGVLELKATIALVDVAVVSSDQNPSRQKVFASEAFRDQVHYADVVVGTKADLASGASVEAFRAWAATLYPAKAEVFVVERGRLPLATLDVPVGFDPSCACAPVLETSHARNAAAVRFRIETETATERVPKPLGVLKVGAPSRVLGGDDAFATAGFAFHRDDVFCRRRLLLFESLRAFGYRAVQGRGARWEGVGRAGVRGGRRRRARARGVPPRQPRRGHRHESRVDDRPGGRAPNEAGLTSGDEAEETVRSAGKAAAACDWDALERAIKAAVKPPRAR